MNVFDLVIILLLLIVTVVQGRAINKLILRLSKVHEVTTGLSKDMSAYIYTDRMLRAPNVDPILIEDHLYYLSSQCWYNGWVSEQDDDVVEAMNTFLTRVLQFKVQHVGVLENGKLLLVAKGSPGEEASKRLKFKTKYTTNTYIPPQSRTAFYGKEAQKQRRSNAIPNINIPMKHGG